MCWVITIVIIVVGIVVVFAHSDGFIDVILKLSTKLIVARHVFPCNCRKNRQTNDAIAMREKSAWQVVPCNATCFLPKMSHKHRHTFDLVLHIYIIFKDSNN